MFLRTRRFTLPATNGFGSVQREVENLLGSLMTDDCNKGTCQSSLRAPAAMWEQDGKVFLDVELPGVTKDSLEITVHNGVLNIRGERRAPEGERKYWLNHRTYGQFDQSVSLPEDVDADSVDARFADGVLSITLTRRPEAQPKKISIHD